MTIPDEPNLPLQRSPNPQFLSAANRSFQRRAGAVGRRRAPIEELQFKPTRTIFLRITICLFLSLGVLTLSSRAASLKLLWQVDLGEPEDYWEGYGCGKDGSLVVGKHNGGSKIIWISSSGKLLATITDAKNFGILTAVSDTGLVISGGNTLADGSTVATSQRVISYYEVELGQVKRLDWVVDGAVLYFSANGIGGYPMKPLGAAVPIPYILITSGTILKCYTLTDTVFDAPVKQPTLTTPLVTNGVFQFTADGISGDLLAIDGSTNMTQWSVIKRIEDPKPTEVIQLPVNDDADRFRVRSH